MKKRNLKSLKLNKKPISNLKGGRPLAQTNEAPSCGGGCVSGFDIQTVCYVECWG
ncbi:hypothetical protein [Kordia sp.]|uniref:hypothetical protein n=1 Tax=Kordia sp. TaxID=1965332 RepID=UPI003D6BEBFC